MHLGLTRHLIFALFSGQVECLFAGSTAKKERSEAKKFEIIWEKRLHIINLNGI